MSEDKDTPLQEQAKKSLRELLDSGDDKELRARVVEVLERGILNDQLAVALPADKHGEWVSNEPRDIHRMKMLGFEIDREYAMSNALHNDGSGNPVLGDVIFMTCPKKIKDIFEQERMKRYKDRHIGKKGKQLIEEASGTDLETINNSTNSRIDKTQLIHTLHAES